MKPIGGRAPMPITPGELLAGGTSEPDALDTRYAGLAEILYCETGGTIYGGNYSNTLGSDYGETPDDTPEPKPVRKYVTRERLTGGTVRQ